MTEASSKLLRDTPALADFRHNLPVWPVRVFFINKLSKYIPTGTLHLRLQAILINRLILNLRSFDQTSSLSFRTDTFSTNRYDPSRSSDAPRSFVDAILGDIGRPLRTTDDEDLDEFNEDFDQSEDTNEHA